MSVLFRSGWSEIDVVRLVVEVLLRNGNNITAGHTAVRGAPLSILVVFKFYNNFLHHGSTRSVQFPNRRFADFGTVKGCSFRENRHTIRILLETPFRTCGQTHNMRPWQTNQFGCIIFILHVIGFRIGVKALDRSQNPTSILISARHLGCNLFPLSSGPFRATALALRLAIFSTIKESRFTGIIGLEHVSLFQAFQESSDAFFLVNFHCFKMTSHSHGQFRWRGFGADLDTMMINVS
mmetsp:Transcript_9918/g.20497  ORF Transcript_9918/g.20497 Transcript_9918/m.20497 type:complete len:237 (-) Transcript_9918:351-1061(-)